jgi:hypothetical protein
VQVVYCAICTFVCVFLLVTGFNPAWSGHYGFLEDREACLLSRRGASAACTGRIVQWMEITELVRIWRTRSADACDRCGVRGESRMVRPRNI